MKKQYSLDYTIISDKERMEAVREIIDTCKKVTGCDFNVEIADRREGDPDILIADASKIKNELGWEPKYDLDCIVSSAWKWHQKVNNI